MAFLTEQNKKKIKNEEILSSANINSKYVFFLTVIFTEGFTAQRIQGGQKKSCHCAGWGIL